MNKNLTNNEIIKALEECIELRFDDDTEYATVRLDTLTNSLDLLTRLQAENKRLSKITRPLIAEIKAEAYKEFAERVKEKIYTAHFGRGKNEFFVTTINHNDLDNLLKEMVGDHNELF